MKGDEVHSMRRLDTHSFVGTFHNWTSGQNVLSTCSTRCHMALWAGSLAFAPSRLASSSVNLAMSATNFSNSGDVQLGIKASHRAPPSSSAKGELFGR